MLDTLGLHVAEIPLMDGPWKFRGLPGLILKAEDDQKLFFYEAVCIEKAVRPIQISSFVDERFTRCTLEQYQKKKRNSLKQYKSISMREYFISQGPLERGSCYFKKQNSISTLMLVEKRMGVILPHPSEIFTQDLKIDYVGKFSFKSADNLKILYPLGWVSLICGL